MPDAEVDYLTLDVYLRGDPKTKYDTLPRFTGLESTDELLGPGGGSFSIQVDDPKLAADMGNLFKHKNIFKVRRNNTNVGAFILQTRELTQVDSNEAASRIWQVSGEGLRGWFRDAVVQPENGSLKKYTPDNRAFNFSCINKSRWYSNSNWSSPVNIAKVRAIGSPYSTKPADWPDAPNSYWIWGDNPNARGTAGQMSTVLAASNALKRVTDQQTVVSKLNNATKENLSDIRSAYNTLGNYCTTMGGNASAVVSITSGTVKADWNAAKSASNAAAAACEIADNGNSTSTQRKAANTAVGKAVTAMNQALTDAMPGPAMAAGDCYFRCEFTAPAAGTYTFYCAANNTIDAYVDGQLVLSMPDSADTFDSVQTVSQDLDAGSHVFAIKVTNTNKSLAGLIAAVFQEGTEATGNTAAVPAKLLQYTGDSSWKVCAYPSVAPGWTPGEIMLQLLQEAQARGVKFPTWVTPTFTEDVDSAGVPWQRSGDFSFDVGTEYFDVLSALEEAGGDAYVDPDSYAFSIYGTRGTNRSGINLTNYTQDTSQLNPVVLRIGKNLLQADNSVTGQIKNTLLVQTADGWSTATSGIDSELGVIEGSYQSNQKSAQSGEIASDALQQFSTPETSSTYGVVPLSDLVPGRDFFTGDYVQAPGDDFVMTARRVSSISYQADENNGLATYSMEFDTIQQDRLTLLERRLDKLMKTGTSVGSSLTSTTSVNLPTTVSSGVPGSPIPVINAPQNLTGETNAYYTTDGQPEASVSLSWDPPLSSADGSIAQNVAYYEVWGGQTGTLIGTIATTNNTNYLVMDLDLDVDYTFRVRARQSDGPNFSNFSNDFEVVTAIPTQQLDKPTPPSVMSKLGVFTVSWDGNLVSDDGSTHGADPRLSQVRLLIGSLQDMSDGAYAGQPLSAQGATVIPNLTVGNTYYFRFTAVDTFGLVSQPSDIVSAVLLGIELTDMDPAVGSVIQNGATILYQPTPPGPSNQNSSTTWYDTAHGYKPYRWNTLGDNNWDPITYGLQDDGSGTAIYSYIQTGAIAANAITALQIQSRAVTADKINVGAVQAQHIQLGNYIPSGYGTNRVPGPLLDSANWISTWTYATASNLNPENVTYTDQGVLMSSTGSARSLWSATAQQPVPASGKVIIDWIASSDSTELWLRLNTANSNSPWWLAVDLDGTTQTSAVGHFVMDFTQYQTYTGRTDGPVTSYAVYMIVEPGQGTSLIKSMAVTEIDPALTSIESVQITQAGVFMYNADGTASMSISVGAKNFFAYNNQDGGAVTLDRLGNGSFSTRVSAKQVYGSDMVGVDDGTFMSTDGITVGGLDLLGTMDDDGTYFGYVETSGVQSAWIDRLARNVIYRGYWDQPDGNNQYSIHAQYQRFASGYFVLQPGRQYTIMVNNGSVQMSQTQNNALSNNLYFDLMLEIGGLSGIMTSGVRAMRSVVFSQYQNQSGQWVHGPITVAAVSGAGLSPSNLSMGVIPAGVPIYWQYGTSLSNVPSAATTVNAWGSGQSLTVIDQGPAFTNYFNPTYANDTSYTGQYSGGGGSSGGTNSGGGGSSSSTTKTITTTKTYAATWSRSWNQNGGGIVSGSGTYTDANMMYQGYGASPMGSMVGFGALGLPSGATVTKVQLYMKNRHFYYNSGADVHIGHHGQSSPPGGFSSGDKFTSANWGYGDGKWVTLPSSWNSSWANGSYRGISLGIDGSTGQYGYFDGNNKSDEPQLKVTYTYKG